MGWEMGGRAACAAQQGRQRPWHQPATHVWALDESPWDAGPPRPTAQYTQTTGQQQPMGNIQAEQAGAYVGALDEPAQDVAPPRPRRNVQRRLEGAGRQSGLHVSTQLH